MRRANIIQRNAPSFPEVHLSNQGRGSVRVNHKSTKGLFTQPYIGKPGSQNLAKEKSKKLSGSLSSFTRFKCPIPGELRARCAHRKNVANISSVNKQSPQVKLSYGSKMFPYETT